MTGGDEDFVRAFSEEVYGIPPEQVIGSAIKLQFIENNSSCSVVKLPEILVFDDGQEKAKEIQLNIGHPPNLCLRQLGRGYSYASNSPPEAIGKA